jgi:hypothetical protein
MENRHATAEELQLATSPCHATIHATVYRNLKMKVCAHWVIKDFTPDQKDRRVKNCQELLTLHNKDPEGLFTGVVTGDES